MTKRMRQQSADDEEMDIPTTADLLLFLSLGRDTAKANVGEASRPSPSDHRFVCKICNRRFGSFQALGGHCTGHKRARVSTLANPLGEMQRAKSKPRVHACTICGLKFGMGQALGGHMRRHKELFDSRGQSRDMDLNTPRLLNLFI